MYAGRKIIFYVNVKKASMGTDYEDRKKKRLVKVILCFETLLSTTVIILKNKRKMKVMI